MNSKKPTNGAKYRILVIWKNTGAGEIYRDLKTFVKYFPAYSYETLANYLTRKNEPFEDDTVKVERKEIIF